MLLIETMQYIHMHILYYTILYYTVYTLYMYVTLFDKIVHWYFVTFHYLSEGWKKINNLALGGATLAYT